MASYEEIQSWEKMSGVGRDILEHRLRVCVKLVCELKESRDRLQIDNKHLNDNVTATQARCTELLEAVRAAKLMTINPQIPLPSGEDECRKCGHKRRTHSAANFVCCGILMSYDPLEGTLSLPCSCKFFTA